MTPFLETRERLRSGAASLLVLVAAQLLKWQDPVRAASEALQFVAAQRREIPANPQTPLPTY